LKDYYDHYWESASWPTTVPRGYQQEVEDLNRLFTLLPVGRVLDAGCGDGSKYAHLLAGRGHAYVGVDLSASAVATAMTSGLDARTVEDLSQLPFADGEFDACVSVEVFEHLLFPELAAVEIRRVLNDRGVFICTVPNVAYWRRRLDLALLGRWHPGGHPRGASYPWKDPHLRFFTRHTLRSMLRRVGFADVYVTGINGSLFGDLPFVGRRFGTQALSRPFRFLQSAIPSLFAANLAAIARR
jgi:SAM-dependent methyltransferase